MLHLAEDSRIEPVDCSRCVTYKIEMEFLYKLNERRLVFWSTRPSSHLWAHVPVSSSTMASGDSICWRSAGAMYQILVPVNSSPVSRIQAPDVHLAIIQAPDVQLAEIHAPDVQLAEYRHLIYPVGSRDVVT